MKRRSYSDEHIYEDIDPLPPPPSQAKDNLNFPSSTFDKGRASKGKLQKGDWKYWEYFPLIMPNSEFVIMWDVFGSNGHD